MFKGVNLQPYYYTTMGVLFLCNDFEFSSSYGNWNIVRMELFHATMRYLEETLTSTASDTVEYDYISKILDTKTTVNNIDDFVGLFQNNQDYIDYYIYLDIVGLYALLFKQDCQGYYSIGNAVDILRLIDRVKSYVQNTITKERLPLFTKMFRTCVKTKTVITIM